MNNTIQLYMDKNQEIKGYPITSPDRVIDENGVNIKQQLDNKANKGSYEFTVSKKNGDYTVIQNAVDSIQDNEYPTTIKIYPGVYNESVSVGANRHLSLIGTNRKDCIIRMDTGDYLDAPLEIQGRALVKNLTFIHTHENSQLDVSTLHGYAVHCDYDGEGITEFENCRFESYQNAAVGCGLRQNQTLRFKNCEFYSYTPTNSGMLVNGAFFCHNAVASGVTGQRLEMINCYFYSQNGDCIYINDANFTVGDGQGNEMLCRFINNTCYSESKYTENTVKVDVKPNDNKYSGCIELSWDSTGNNSTGLNKSFNHWFYPSITNCVNFGNGFAPLQYTKDKVNNVNIQGVIKECNRGTIFYLPVGCRPSYTLIFPVVSNYSNGEIKTGSVYIYSDGKVDLMDNIGDGFMSINISFLADK